MLRTIRECDELTLAAFARKLAISRANLCDIEHGRKGVSVERAGALRDGESAIAWFYRVLRNAVVDHHRRRGAASRAMDGFARELDEPPAEVQEAVCACVLELARTLKPEYEEARRRLDVDGASVQGYAAEAGIQANNAGVRVHRAREALRKRVKAACGTCADHGCLDCACQPAPTPEKS